MKLAFMSRTNQSFALFLVILVASPVFAVLLATPVSAQSTPRPSASEFTLKATGSALEVTVKNQPVSAYENGSTPSLYYMFRFKDHNARVGDWNYDPNFYVLPSTYGGYYRASNADSTNVSLSLENYRFPSGQIDIQAIALVGRQYPTNYENGRVYGFEGVIGDWSNMQTITVAASSVSPSPTATADDRNPDSAVIIPVIGVALVLAALIAMLLYGMHRKNTLAKKQ